MVLGEWCTPKRCSSSSAVSCHAASTRLALRSAAISRAGGGSVFSHVFRAIAHIKRRRITERAVQPEDGALPDRIVVDQGDQLAQARKLDGLPGQPDFRVAFAGGRGVLGDCNRFRHDGKMVSARSSPLTQACSTQFRQSRHIGQGDIAKSCRYPLRRMHRPILAKDIRGDTVGNAGCRFVHRITRKVCIARGRVDFAVTQKLADHRQAFAQCQGSGCKGGLRS